METDFLAFLVTKGLLTAQQRDTIRQTVRTSREPIGAIAFAHGLLNTEDIDLVLSRQRNEHRPFGQIAAELGILTQHQVGMLLQMQNARTAMALAEALSLAGVLPLAALMTELAHFIAPAPQSAKAA
jgi:hypothetical protein